jgi:hypothetical protein
MPCAALARRQQLTHPGLPETQAEIDRLGKEFSTATR